MSKKKNIVPKDGLPANTKGLNEILLYTIPNGSVKIEIYLQDETVWLTQQKIADLFGVQRPAITKHLKNIFETAELKEELVRSEEHTSEFPSLILISYAFFFLKKKTILYLLFF